MKLCLWFLLSNSSLWSLVAFPPGTFQRHLWLHGAINLCPCRSLAGSMLFCHLIKYMMVMTRATLMSPRLCWWGTALVFNRFCSGCDLLVISCRICVKTRLCPLGEALFCADQAAENNVSSVKATSSKGSHEELSIRMPHWNTASFAKACCQQRLHGPLAVQRAWLPPFDVGNLEALQAALWCHLADEGLNLSACA